MATHFSNDHPFVDFDKDFYLESDCPSEHIYIFKFPEETNENGRKTCCGAEVVTHYDRKTAFVSVERLIFIDEYNWELDTNRTAWFRTASRGSMRDILELARKELISLKYGKQRKDS